MKSVLIIEDNKEISSQMEKYLVNNGYEVELASSFYEASYKMNVDMDVALLDINLPDKDGQHLIEGLKDKDIRVIVTTVKNDEDFIIASLDKGADDYLTKPFSLAILRARIDAVLRTIPLSQDKKITYKDIKVDLNDSKVYFKNNQIDLTPLEYEILLLFIKNPHRVFTRSQLLEMFWEDRDKFVNDNTLTSTIKRIREKLDREVINTVRGIGYRMDWMLYVFWIISLLLMYYFLEKRKKNRINELIDLIEKMKNRDYKIPMKQDDFSILEDKIYKLFIEIVEAKETSSKNSEKQIEYLEDIAHQIKTPITSMLFSIENLGMDFPDIEDIEILKRQTIRLNSLSDILLKLSSLDANKDLMKKEEICLDELVDYALDSLDLRRSTNVEVAQSLKENSIYGDFYWLAEALINIVKNADNRPTCDKIVVSSYKNPLYTSLIIEDNGGGIEKENMKKIFKRFYKTPDSNGFGIGLAMARTIVEKNNGEISVSNIKEGARFEIKFYNVT